MLNQFILFGREVNFRFLIKKPVTGTTFTLIYLPIQAKKGQ